MAAARRDSAPAAPTVLAPLMETVEGVAEATTLGPLPVVVVLDAGQVAEPLRVLVHVV